MVMLQSDEVPSIFHWCCRFLKGVHQHQVNGERVLDVSPLSGRLVVFLSGAIDHAVLPSHEPRVALTAWCQ